MKIKFFTAAIAALLFAFVSTSAEAKHRTHHRHYARHHAERVVALTTFGTSCDNNGRCFSAGTVEPARQRGETRTASYDDGRVVSHPAGCPHSAFCGCGVSVKVFGHPVRNLYLAANWLKYPRAAPGPGMVAARHGHVMYIEAIDANGNAVVYDPNSGGHQTRVHTRSLAGYHVVNPHAG